jgi:hypothetical protein
MIQILCGTASFGYEAVTTSCFVLLAEFDRSIASVHRYADTPKNSFAGNFRFDEVDAPVTKHCGIARPQFVVFRPGRLLGRFGGNLHHP